MRGSPKYKVGDLISFTIKGKTKQGEIYIVDKYGTFFDPSDVSYDIYVAEDNMLYKHVSEQLLE